MRRNVSRVDVNVRRIAAILAAGIGALLLALGLVAYGASFLAVAAYLMLTSLLEFAPEYVPFHFATRNPRQRGPIDK